MSGPDSPDDRWQQLAMLIVKTAPLQVEHWSRETHLINDLGYDSIAAIELVFEVERTLDCDPLPDDLGFSAETVGTLADAMFEHLESH